MDAAAAWAQHRLLRPLGLAEQVIIGIENVGVLVNPVIRGRPRGPAA